METPQPQILPSLKPVRLLSLGESTLKCLSLCSSSLCYCNEKSVIIENARSGNQTILHIFDSHKSILNATRGSIDGTTWIATILANNVSFSYEVDMFSV